MSKSEQIYCKWCDGMYSADHWQVSPNGKRRNPDMPCKTENARRTVRTKTAKPKRRRTRRTQAYRPNGNATELRLTALDILDNHTVHEARYIARVVTALADVQTR